MSPREIEAAMIDAFVAAEKRGRWHMKLAQFRQRRKFLDRLNHANDFDYRYATAVRHDADFAALLRRRGAPDHCHVISDVAHLDGRTLPLEEAIEQTQRFGWGTVICCIPGELAFYDAEGGEECLILWREREEAAAH